MQVNGVSTEGRSGNSPNSESSHWGRANPLFEGDYDEIPDDLQTNNVTRPLENTGYDVPSRRQNPEEGISDGHPVDQHDYEKLRHQHKEDHCCTSRRRTLAVGLGAALLVIVAGVAVAVWYFTKNSAVNIACSPSPCQNGGTCQTSGASGYVCHCAGWVGTNCEIDATPCTPDPCTSGQGTCDVTGTTSYNCVCVVGYSGILCEDDVCTGHTCVNGACNRLSATTYTCTCNIGWSGDDCDMECDPYVGTAAPSGTAFDQSEYSQVITSMKINVLTDSIGTSVKSLWVDYTSSDAGWEGTQGTGTDWSQATITLDPGEFITTVSGQYGIDPTSGGTENIITEITFETSTGATHGPYGGTPRASGAMSFSVTGTKLLYFSGFVDDDEGINALTLHFDCS